MTQLTQQLEVHGLGTRRIVSFDETLHSDAPLGFQVIARPLTVGMRGFDTSQKLTAVQYQWAKANGFDFAVRYAPLAGQSPAVGIDAAELAAGLSSGLGMMIVQFSRTGGLTQQQGHDDGEALVARLKTLSLPLAVSMWGDFYPADAATMKAYGNALFAGTIAAGAPATSFGGYNEPGVPAGLDLYRDYDFHRYWRTNGQVPNVENRGFQILQLFPGNRLVGPPGAQFLIDYDFAQSDWRGDAPMAAFKVTS